MAQTTAALQASRTEVPLWRRLVVATPVGWALGVVAGVVLIVVVESLGIREVQTPLVLGVALGVSVQQSRALRPVLGATRLRWVILSCLGLMAPFIAADAAAALGRPRTYNLVVFVILGGLILSVLQWSVLRLVVHRARGWLIASPTGYIAAAGTLWFSDHVLPKTPGIAGALQYLAVILFGGVLLGVPTAIAAGRFQPHASSGSHNVV